MRIAAARMGTLLVTVATLAACGTSTPSPTPAQSAGASSAPGESAAAASLAPLPDGEVPAGVQFIADSIELPPNFGSINAQLGDRTIFFGRRDNLPAIAERVGEAWTVGTIDRAGGLDPPSGYSVPGGGALTFFPNAATTGPNGVVAIGSAGVANPSLPTAAQAHQLSVFWSLTDGVSWVRSDPRAAVAEADAIVLLLDLRATPSGYLAVGGVGSATDPGPTEAIILRSADGITWTTAARFGATWSLTARTIHVGSGRIVVAGTEHVCDATPGPLTTGASVGGPTLAWESEDAGSTWQPIDMTGAEPVLGPPEPAPGDASGCPAGADIATLNARFGATGRIVGIGGDQLVAVSDDGARSATNGGSSWSVADVPGGSAASGADGGAPRGAATTLFTADANGWILRRLEARRDENGRQRRTGCHVYWWRSVDHGSSWAAGPLARPVRSCDGGLFRLQERSDGSVIFFLLALPVTPNPISSYRISTAGPLVAWDSCAPGPGADCAFATLDGPAGNDVDWSGIDLFGADVVNAQLDGVNLTGARLSGARVEGSFVGAHLPDLSLFGVTLAGDFSGADFRNGDASRAVFDATLAGANLSGMSLTLVTFHGDLTGADFTGAFLGDVTFLAGTTCPDGAPATDAPGLAACRMG